MVCEQRMDPRSRGLIPKRKDVITLVYPTAVHRRDDPLTRYCKTFNAMGGHCQAPTRSWNLQFRHRARPE